MQEIDPEEKEIIEANCRAYDAMDKKEARIHRDGLQPQARRRVLTVCKRSKRSSRKRRLRVHVVDEVHFMWILKY